MKEPQIRDSKQFGYAVLIFLFFIGIGVIILAGGDFFSLFMGVVLVLISLSPLFYWFYQAWKVE